MKRDVYGLEASIMVECQFSSNWFRGLTQFNEIDQLDATIYMEKEKNLEYPIHILIK